MAPPALRERAITSTVQSMVRSQQPSQAVRLLDTLVRRGVITRGQMNQYLRQLSGRPNS